MPTVLVDLTSLNTDSRFRGMGRYIRDLAVGLSRLDASERQGLTILGLTSYDWAGRYRVTDDLGSFRGHGDNPPAWLRYAWVHKRRVALWRVAQATGARVVHLGEPAGTPIGLSAVGARLVMTCHDLIERHFPDRYVKAVDGGRALAEKLQRRRFGSADIVVAISEATRSDVVRFLGLPRSHVERVYNGVDLQRWSRPTPADNANIVAELGLVGTPFVLYVGDADWRKNIEGMVAGIARAHAEGARVKLVLAGIHSAERAASVDSLAARFGVTSSVVRVGYVPDDALLALYRAARAHLFVSRMEGFGLTVVEAMAAGCPVITTACGSLAEVAGDAALIVGPDDHDAIGAAIARVCVDDALRDDLAKRGKARSQQFSLENQARAMIQVYRKAADLCDRDAGLPRFEGQGELRRDRNPPGLFRVSRKNIR